MSSGIYKITNTVTGKCYVGSAKNFEARWSRHFKDLKAGRHSSIKFQRTFNKYGENVFIPEIIEEVEYTKNLIIERENFWIKTLNSKENGYNIADASFGDVLSNHPDKDKIIAKRTKTIIENCAVMTVEERTAKFGKPGKLNGMFGKTHTQEVKTKLSELNKGNSNRLGKKLTDESVRERLSEIGKARIGESNGMFGKTHSEETKRKLSELKKGIKPANTLRYSIDGVVYNGLNEAEAALNVKRGTVRHRCLSSNKKYETWFILPSSS